MKLYVYCHIEKKFQTNGQNHIKIQFTVYTKFCKMKVHKIFIFTISVFLFFYQTNGESSFKHTNEENDILYQWKEMDKSVKKTVSSVVKTFLPKVMEAANQMNLSTQCMKESMQLISGIRNLKLWAFSFIDSSSKSIDGMLSGTLSSLGVYDQCLNSMAPSRDPNKPAFRGQYCQINIRPPLPFKNKKYRFAEGLQELENFTGSEVVKFAVHRASVLYWHPFRLALCLPSGCNDNDISQASKEIASKMHWETEVNFCEVKKPVEYTLLATIATVLCSLLVSIALLATVFDVYLTDNGIVFENIVYEIFLSFSLAKTFKSFTSTNISVEKLKCLHGIRFMTIVMVVMSNSYLYPVFMITIYKSLLYAYDMMTHPLGQILMNISVVIDTFFFIGGLLVSYLTIKHEKIDKKKLNIKTYILHKLWKVIPVYYFILFITMLTPLMGSGPNFREAMKFSVDDCYKYCWTNLLFLNNFFIFDEMCLVHTWFISCDIQLHLSAIVVLLPLLRSEKVGIALSLLIVVMSGVYTGAMTYFYELIPGLSIEYIDQDFIAETLLKTYGNPLTHAGPFYIGVIVGYILVMKPDIEISKTCRIIGWIVAVGCVSYSMFWTAQWKYYTPSLIETSIYSSLYRTIWTIGVAWMTFCCCTGHGGFLNTFFTWKPWIPLAKLSFLIYLIQPTLLTMHIGIFKSTQDFTHFQIFVTYFGLLLISGFLALLCNLLIESPLRRVEKQLFGNSEGQETDLDTIIHVEKHLNGNIKSEKRNGVEMDIFSHCVDNVALDRTEL